MPQQSQSPIFCALDTPSTPDALAQAKTLKGHVAGIKLGLEFFLANGPKAIVEMSGAGLPIFLDLKLHDIPNTVAGAVRSLAPLGVDILTIHTQGGENMMRAAVDSAFEAAAKLAIKPPKIIGVTILTSLDNKDLTKIGVNRGVEEQVVGLASLAKESGLDGVVCSPKEIGAIRNNIGSDFKLIVPGIRPEGATVGDQKRVLTPKEAVNAGADILVIGRPITQAKSPADAAIAINESLN